VTAGRASALPPRRHRPEPTRRSRPSSADWWGAVSIVQTGMGWVAGPAGGATANAGDWASWPRHHDARRAAAAVATWPPDGQALRGEPADDAPTSRTGWLSWCRRVKWPASPSPRPTWCTGWPGGDRGHPTVGPGVTREVAEWGSRGHRPGPRAAPHRCGPTTLLLPRWWRRWGQGGRHRRRRLLLGRAWWPPWPTGRRDGHGTRFLLTRESTVPDE